MSAFHWLVISLVIASSAQAETMDLNRSDHKLHLGASAGVALLSSELYRDMGAETHIGLGVLTAIGVGLVKEVSDPVFSESDFQADALGAALGGLASFTISF